MSGLPGIAAQTSVKVPPRSRERCQLVIGIWLSRQLALYLPMANLMLLGWTGGGSVSTAILSNVVGDNSSGQLVLGYLFIG